MSLLLKKKGGKFAPKIPQKRSGAPSSTQSSTRPSVERQSQTPAPLSHTVETIIVPDDDGTPAPSDELSGFVENTPPQPTVRISKDTPPRAGSPLENTALNTSQDTVVPPDEQGLKRKTRDQDAAVEIASKRHQPSSLNAPRCPAPSANSQITEPRSQLNEQLQSTAQVFTEPSQTDTNLPDSLQTKQATTAAPFKVISTNAESSQATSQLSEHVITTPRRHPLPDNTQIPRDGGSPETSTNGLGPAGDVGLGVGGGQLAQTPVIVSMALLNPDGTPGESVQQPAPGPKRKIPRRRKVQQGEDGGDVRATVEMQLNRPRRVPGKKSKKDKKDDKKKGKRAETPEGAEDEEINKHEIKVLDLTKDLRIGKKFSLHDELRQREKDKIIQTQLAKTHPELVNAMEEVEEAESPREEAQPLSRGVQMKVVNGVVVVDQESMQLDRQKDARAEQGNIEAVVENDFSKMTTCGTHMKRERAQLWDMAANEIFWKGLRMFGTDFEMIAKMFPHRNRRQIKLKFNKEEKDNPAKMDRILKGAGSSIELDTYEELSGVKLEEVEAIEAEREELAASQSAEIEKRIADHAAAEKKKKETIDAARDTPRGADDGTGEKENQQRSQSGGPQAEGQKTFVRSKKAPRARKDGTVAKARKKPAADETVQILGDA